MLCLYFLYLLCIGDVRAYDAVDVLNIEMLDDGNVGVFIVYYHYPRNGSLCLPAAVLDQQALVFARVR